MTVTLEIPEEFVRTGSDATRFSREAFGLEALRQGLWGEAELGRFLGLTRVALDQFLKSRGVELNFTWDDLQAEREVHRQLAGS